jgi:hypothetical protein
MKLKGKVIILKMTCAASKKSVKPLHYLRLNSEELSKRGPHFYEI